MSTTRSANSRTPGVIPGISAITMTAGPDPFLYTSRVLPPWVNVVVSKPARGSAMAAHGSDVDAYDHLAVSNPVYVRLFYEDEAAALEWLVRVFGCTETTRKTNPDG